MAEDPSRTQQEVARGAESEPGRTCVESALFTAAIVRVQDDSRRRYVVAYTGVMTLDGATGYTFIRVNGHTYCVEGFRRGSSTFICALMGSSEDEQVRMVACGPREQLPTLMAAVRWEVTEDTDEYRRCYCIPPEQGHRNQLDVQARREDLFTFPWGLARYRGILYRAEVVAIHRTRVTVELGIALAYGRPDACHGKRLRLPLEWDWEGHNPARGGRAWGSQAFLPMELMADERGLVWDAAQAGVE